MIPAPVPPPGLEHAQKPGHSLSGEVPGPTSSD